MPTGWINRAVTWQQLQQVLFSNCWVQRILAFQTIILRRKSWGELKTEGYTCVPVSIKEDEGEEGWIKVSDKLPATGSEVISFNKKWIDEDFNPKGIRAATFCCDWDEGNQWMTARYNPSQDSYINETADEPTHYRLLPNPPQS